MLINGTTGYALSRRRQEAALLLSRRRRSRSSRRRPAHHSRRQHLRHCRRQLRQPPARTKSATAQLDLANMQAEIDPRAEWKEMFERSLSPGARLFLRALHERRRLGQRARQIRAASPLRRRSLRPNLRSRRIHRRAFEFPHLRRRRRLARSASGKCRPARRRFRSRLRQRPLPLQENLSRRKLGRPPALAPHRARR